jgi:hypothetical protein
MEEALELTDRTVDETEDMTVGILYDSIETNLWLADAYFLRGAKGLAIECLRSAWLEYVRFRDVLRVYAGDDLGDRLLRTLVSKAGDEAAALALGPEAGEKALELALASLDGEAVVAQ